MKGEGGTAEWTDSGGLFHFKGAQEWNGFAPALFTTLQANREIPLCDLNERDGSDVVA